MAPFSVFAGATDVQSRISNAENCEGHCTNCTSLLVFFSHQLLKSRSDAELGPAASCSPAALPLCGGGALQKDPSSRVRAQHPHAEFKLVMSSDNPSIV